MLLELAKKCNTPRRNFMKIKEKLGEAIKDTIIRYKETIFGSDTPTCMACLGQLRKQQTIDLKVYDQDGRYSEKTCMGGTSKKYCDGW